MENETVHDLTPAYALDALDAIERAAYEAHLATCERCREELAVLQDSAASLAYAVESPAPPRQLRERILAQARAERNVIPFRRRRVDYVLGAAAAAAASVAIGLGIWGWSLANERDELRSALQARVIALSDDAGRLHIEPDGEATLVASTTPAPRGKDYEIWVIDGGTPRAAGLFDGGREIVRLTRPVPRGAQVAVTLERDGGVDAPTSEPLFAAET